jgi:transposase
MGVHALQDIDSTALTAEVIDNPTSGSLPHVLVAKHADHLPLYRQEANLVARLADALKSHVFNCQVVHAD